MLYTEFNIDIAKEVWQEEAREELLDIIAENKAEIAENKAEIAENKAEIAENKAEIARLTALVEQLQSEA